MFFTSRTSKIQAHTGRSPPAASRLVRLGTGTFHIESSDQTQRFTYVPYRDNIQWVLCRGGHLRNGPAEDASHPWDFAGAGCVIGLCHRRRQRLAPPRFHDRRALPLLSSGSPGSYPSRIPAVHCSPQAGCFPAARGRHGAAGGPGIFTNCSTRTAHRVASNLSL